MKAEDREEKKTNTIERRKMKRLLRGVADGKISLEKAVEAFRQFPIANLGFSRVDTHRQLRTGVGEVIFCPGKTIDQVIAIMKKLTSVGQNAIATRADPILFQAVREALPEAQYYAPAQIIAAGKFPKSRGKRVIMVVSAGTSDIPVAEEAAVTAELLGSQVERLYDVGVAGIHRLFRDVKRLQAASVLIVVAGMEGALASVVGGLVSKPVIAVPTSVGYGASFHGISALLTMLNSCAPGIATVNIDNGFGAGFLAHRILNIR